MEQVQTEWEGSKQGKKHTGRRKTDKWEQRVTQTETEENKVPVGQRERVASCGCKRYSATNRQSRLGKVKMPEPLFGVGPIKHTRR